jgi:hypothetical protein
VGLVAVGAASVTNFGTIEGLGVTAVSFASAADVLNVEAGSTFVGAVLGGGGTLDLASGIGALTALLSSGSVSVSGSMAATTFQNFAMVEVGSGATFTGGGAVSLAAGQTLDGAGILTLGGSAKNSNAGLIETTGAGMLTLTGALANTGTLATMGGTLTVKGAVTGTGGAVIKGGMLDLASGFNEAVTFAGTTGVLELAQSQT